MLLQKISDRDRWRCYQCYQSVTGVEHKIKCSHSLVIISLHWWRNILKPHTNLILPSYYPNNGILTGRCGSGVDVLLTEVDIICNSWWQFELVRKYYSSSHLSSLSSLSQSLQPKDKLTQNVNKFWNSSGNSENWKTYQLSLETEGKNQIELKDHFFTNSMHAVMSFFIF